MAGLHTAAYQLLWTGFHAACRLAIRPVVLHCLSALIPPLTPTRIHPSLHAPQLRMMGSPIVEVRVQGCWSLRNLAYKSNEAFKQQLLEVQGGEGGEMQRGEGGMIEQQLLFQDGEQEGGLPNASMPPEMPPIYFSAPSPQTLSWSHMRRLLDDAEADVQEHAVCTLRNLCMGSERSIQAVMDWGGADLLVCLEEKLDLTRCGSGVEI